MNITIRAGGTGAVLARGEEGKDVFSYEGNWYFDPSAVDRGLLQRTSRTYTCPYKGTCYWVDYVDPGGKTVPNVAWLYESPKPGHEVIKDRFGFYAGARGATKQD